MKYLLALFFFAAEASASTSVPDVQSLSLAGMISPLVAMRSQPKKNKPVADRVCPPGARHALAQWPPFIPTRPELRAKSRGGDLDCPPSQRGGKIDAMISIGRDLLRRLLPGAAVNLN